jgi:hypothetical protein
VVAADGGGAGGRDARKRNKQEDILDWRWGKLRARPGALRH